VDLVSIVKKIEEELEQIAASGLDLSTKKLLLAVMGCEVNGPGEAKFADIGIAFGKDSGVIFKHGEIIKTVKADQAVAELVSMVKEEL